jgi:iron complex transport system ATP-binding protein
VSRLDVETLSVELGGRCVVDRLTVTVADGEWAALIGPNGAGKTSALRAIAGLVPATGTVRLSGADAARMRRRERARRIALVPQVPTTPPDMTVREYVLLGRTPYAGYFGGTGAGDRAAANRALERLGLGELAARRLESLSGGERQRAVLARAVAQEAEVVLLDEPTSALDLARQQQVLGLVDRLRREEGVAVVAAMHDLTGVALYADHVHLLSSGRLVATGAPRAVLREELLSEHYAATVRVFEHDGELVVFSARAGASA